MRASSFFAKKLSTCAADDSSCDLVYSLPVWKPPLADEIALAERTCCRTKQHMLADR